jgi:hypothetical protein
MLKLKYEGDSKRGGRAFERFKITVSRSRRYSLYHIWSPRRLEGTAYCWIIGFIKNSPDCGNLRADEQTNFIYYP